MGNAAAPADRLMKKQSVRRTVWITNDEDAAEAYEEAKVETATKRMELDAERTRPQPNNVAQYRRELEALEIKEQAAYDGMKATSIKFVFRGLSRKKFEQLQDDHPPTDAQRKAIEDQGMDPNSLSYDAQTFAPALCQAALVEPADFNVAAVFDDEDWNQAECASLFQCALSAQMTRRVVDAKKD